MNSLHEKSPRKRMEKRSRKLHHRCSVQHMNYYVTLIVYVHCCSSGLVSSLILYTRRSVTEKKIAKEWLLTYFGLQNYFHWCTKLFCFKIERWELWTKQANRTRLWVRLTISSVSFLTIEIDWRAYNFFEAKHWKSKPFQRK